MATDGKQMSVSDGGGDEAASAFIPRGVDVPVTLLFAGASVAAIVGPAILVSGSAGAAQSWYPPFVDDVCETAAQTSSVVFPVNAMASVAYVLVGLAILAFAAVDATKLMKMPLRSVPPVRLLSRLPAWSAAWGGWTLALGVASFASFVTGDVYDGRVVRFCWWALAIHMIAYAWARFVLDRPTVHEIGCYGCMCVVQVMDAWWLDRYASTAVLALAAGVDVGLWFLAQADTQWVEQLAAVVLLGLLAVPVALHYHLCWREYDEAWDRLGIAAALAVGAVLMRRCDALAGACIPDSVAQPFAVWQVASALAVGFAFLFFHGGREAPHYVVVVQKEGDVPATPRDSLRELAASSRGSVHSQAVLGLPPSSPRGSLHSLPRAGSVHSLPRVGSVHSTGSTHSNASSRQRPGTSRRSMDGAILTLADEQQSTLRLLSQLQTSSRSLESARANLGMATDPRVTLSAEESARQRRASIEAALEQHRLSSVEPSGGLSLQERLAMMNAQRDGGEP